MLINQRSSAVAVFKSLGQVQQHYDVISEGGSVLTNHQGLVGGSALLLEQNFNKVISQLHSHSVTVTFLTSKMKFCQ